VWRRRCAAPGERPREAGEGAVAEPPHRGGREPDHPSNGADPEALPVPEPEQEPQDRLLTGRQARELLLRASAIDRQDRQVLGRGARRIDEPFGPEAVRAVVARRIDHHEGDVMPPVPPAVFGIASRRGSRQPAP
jgi:hypothetical protein